VSTGIIVTGDKSPYHLFAGQQFRSEPRASLSGSGSGVRIGAEISSGSTTIVLSGSPMCPGSLFAARTVLHRRGLDLLIRLIDPCHMPSGVIP
jgi:hypothetical protein